MARKRMISPEIWESSSFSKLSDFAKLVFIGMISQADDEGKGRASPNILRSKLFPDGEEKRVADIKKALSEIALRMSTTIYEVDGDSFYRLDNWHSWQKIDRPTPSKLPDPPQNNIPAGERGRSTQNQNFGKDSSRTRRGLVEGSTTNRIERNRIEYPLYPPKGDGEEERDRFFSSFPKLKALDRLAPFKPDYSALYERFQKSEFLRLRFSAKWVIENYSDIISGMYDDQARAEEQAREREEWYRARRERAEDVAELNRKKAEALDGYAEDLMQVKRFEIAAAKAEASGTVNDAADISSELSRLREKLKQRLASIGLTEADLLPEYSCKKCNDTGFLPNGKPCNCYREKTR